MSSWSPAWESIPLRTVAEFRNGINFDASNRGQGIKVIGVANFQNNVDVPYAELNEINPAGVVRDEDLLRENDFVFVRSNGNRALIGRSLFVRNLPCSVTHSGFTIRLRFQSETIAPDFFAQVFRSSIIRDEISGLGSGTNISNLSQQILGNLMIPVPPLAEQRKIATILSTWDEAITLTRQLIAALQRRKQALMQLLLTGAVRFSEFEGGWTDIRLGDFLTPTLRKVEKPTTPYYALSLRNRGQGTLVRYVEDPNAVEMDYLYEVKEGDLIVSITFAWEGSIALVGSEGDGKLVSHRFPTYVFNKAKVSASFFKYLMTLDNFFFQLGLISPGGAGRNRVLSKRDFLNLVVSIPELDEQEHIGAILAANDEYIAGIEQYLTQLQQQKRGLMEQILTGAVRVAGEISNG